MHFPYTVQELFTSSFLFPVSELWWKFSAKVRKIDRVGYYKRIHSKVSGNWLWCRMRFWRYHKTYNRIKLNNLINLLHLQKIYSDESIDSKEKDRQMIRLITDMMSDPRIQARVIRMLEKYLQGTDARTATHLVLMAMEVSFACF